MRRGILVVASLLLLAACAAPPKPFEHDSSQSSLRRLPADKIELAIGPPRNMPPGMGERVAAALAIELQAYGIVAATKPSAAPVQVTGVMSTRDADLGIEIQIDWRVDGAPQTQEPATSKTRTRPEDYAEASDRLVSRIAQQAAPRVATLIGRPPTFQARSPGQVAAGLSVPVDPPPEVAAAMAAANVPGSAPASSSSTREARVKVLVAPVTGAPSDGNRQLYSGMRRALGSSKIVIVDEAGSDVFSIVGTVNLKQIDDRTGQLIIKWFVKDPTGKNVGDLEQSNPVPLAAARGSWAGFGDIVATAASEGVLELLEKAINRPR